MFLILRSNLFYYALLTSVFKVSLKFVSNSAIIVKVLSYLANVKPWPRNIPVRALEVIPQFDRGEQDQYEGRDPDQNGLVEALREVGLGRVPRLARVPELGTAELLEAHGEERLDAVVLLKY